MGIVASVVAAVAASVAEAVADVVAVGAATAAGSAADAVASGMELVGAVGEAASDTVPLLADEEETVFDSSWVGEGASYADEGAVNDPWNWQEMDIDDGAGAASRGGRVARALGVGAGVGVGAGIMSAIGLAAASKGEAGRDVLQASQVAQHEMEAEGIPDLSSILPDSVLAFITPEEYEWAHEELQRRQRTGGFNPDTLQEAENAVVYSDPADTIPYADPDPSLLFDMAQSEESPPWYLPGAAGQPLTRGMLRRMAQAQEVIERGREVGQVFRVSAELRRELQRSGRALERVYQQVINRQPAGAPDPRDIARAVAGQALEIGIDQGQQAINNLLGGGAIATTLAGMVTAGGLTLYDRFIGPRLPWGSVQIKNEDYDKAPYLIHAYGGLWRKGQSSYIVDDAGRLGTVNLSYYSPETTNRGLPSTEPWFHFSPRTQDQLRNLEFWLKNNWGGNHTYMGLSAEGNFIIGDLVLQEAQYQNVNRRTKKRRHAGVKRRARDTGSGPRPKRKSRARN